jgi:hypothetical protein
MSHPVATSGVPERQLCRRGTSRAWIGVLLAVFASVFSTDNVAASCGNYLFRHGIPVQIHGDDGQASIDDTGFAVDVLFASGVPRQHTIPPCRGPNCSRSPVPLAPVPAVPVNLLRSLDPAALLELASASTETRRAIELPESERGARYLPSSIFRPPAA